MNITKLTKLQLLCLKVKNPDLTELQLARIDLRIKELDAAMPHKIADQAKARDRFSRGIDQLYKQLGMEVQYVASRNS